MNEPAFRTVTNMRKSHDLKGAWEFGFRALEASPQDAYLKGALFWVCYEFIKLQQERIVKRGASSNNYHPNDFEFEQIESLLQTIMRLEIATGGLEYKMLLVQFKKNLEWFPTLIHCVLKQQAALFDEESTRPFQAEKGEVPSLMLSTARQIAHAWLRSHKYWQLDLDLVMRFIDVTKTKVADTKHLIWLDYDLSKCLVVAGQLEQARALILPILRKKQRESWAWGALAATYLEQDNELAMKFFAKGIVSAHDVTFSLQLLQGIVPLLLAKQQQAEASMCVKTEVKAYETNGWKIKKELELLQQQAWYDASVDESLLHPYLKSISGDTLGYLLGPMEKVVAIVENIHKSGKGFQTYVNRTTELSVRMGAFKSKKKPHPGDYVELSIATTDGEKEVISCAPCQQVDIDDVCLVEGDLRITPKGFGFVEDTFVLPFIIGDIPSGARVRVLQVMSWDKVKSRHGHKAITITELK